MNSMADTKSQLFKWQIILTVTMLFWSSLYIVSKSLLQDYNPISVVVYRLIFGSLILGIIYALSKKKTPVKPLSKKDYLLLFVASVIGVLAASTFLLFGVKLAGAAITSILMNSNPFFIVIIAAIIGMEKFSIPKVIGVVVGVIGVVLVVMNGQGVNIGESRQVFIGMIYGILAAFSVAVLSIIGKKCLISKLGGLRYTLYTLIPSGLLLCVYYLIVNRSIFTIHSLPDLFGFVYIGIVPTGIAWWLYAASLRHLDVGLASTYKLLIPVFSVILAFVFFGEQLSWQAYAGMLVIFAGILTVSNDCTIRKKFKTN